MHVNYKGGGQAVQDLLGGQIQMLMTGLATVEGHLKGGKLRALAFTSAKRVPGAPDVPTLTESGYPGLEVLSWCGILAPAGTPQDIVRKLNADINRILQAPDVRERLTSMFPSSANAREEKVPRIKFRMKAKPFVRNFSAIASRCLILFSFANVSGNWSFERAPYAEVNAALRPRSTSMPISRIKPTTK